MRSRFKVTLGGTLFAVAIVMVGAGAVISANNLLFLVLAAMLATLLVSGLVSRLCLSGLQLDLILPDHIAARQTTQARLRLRNIKHWMPSFSIEVIAQPVGDLPPAVVAPVYFPLVPAGGTIEEIVPACFSRRGMHGHNLFVFATKFPFGFLEKTVLVGLRKDTLVYPSIESLPGFEQIMTGISGELAATLRGVSGDFYRIRPYEPTESARHVDWKATAHTGALQLREFAREHHPVVEIVLDRSIPEGAEVFFELAVSCCAFLVWRLTELEIGIHFRSDNCDLRTPDESEVYAILKYLALVTTHNPTKLEPSVDTRELQILLSAAPARYLEQGWAPDRVVDPAVLAASAAGSANNPGK